jgi:hypothetical protein
MSRIAALLLLGAAACAHDHAIDRGEVGEMKNASPAIAPWPGPIADPVASGSAGVPAMAVIDRVHGMAVQVFAAASAEKINTASGVLVGDGLVLTDLRALQLAGSDGGLQPAREIAVLTAEGAFPARIVDSALDAGVAVLELPEAARPLEGPPLAEGTSGDQLVALRASKQGPAFLIEVIGFSIRRIEDPLGMRSASGLPLGFAGAPVFDADGALAGILVSPKENDIVLVPSPRLAQILARIQSPAPQVGDHI